MSIRNERDIILKHALEKENLETALDIGFAFDDLRKKIIVGFLNKLEEFILDRLPDASEWKSSTDVDAPLERQFLWLQEKRVE